MEVIVQGSLHVQIELPQWAASADDDLQHPIEAIPVPGHLGQPARVASGCEQSSSTYAGKCKPLQQLGINCMPSPELQHARPG